MGDHCVKDFSATNYEFAKLLPVLIAINAIVGITPCFRLKHKMQGHYTFTVNVNDIQASI